ncbi:hypothetical protein ALC57_03462 [Trachymyrmex cornetzi]|uniref:Uncharacterized protein n=1 Tax=Trachymyrmex cornetzi TaxID=471704 RepID=A0A195EGW5_9HYME|nr:hypothetical protein ALC57_03462 [Trachymyrmex cornetzi]
MGPNVGEIQRDVVSATVASEPNSLRGHSVQEPRDSETDFPTYKIHNGGRSWSQSQTERDGEARLVRSVQTAKHVVASASRHHAEMRTGGSVNRPCRWYSASSLWDVQSVLCVSVLPATLSLHEVRFNGGRDEALSLGRPTLRLAFTDENEWCAFSASLYYEIDQRGGIDRRRPL